MCTNKLTQWRVVKESGQQIGGTFRKRKAAVFLRDVLQDTSAGGKYRVEKVKGGA
jgi:hypothetical protein